MRSLTDGGVSAVAPRPRETSEILNAGDRRRRVLVLGGTTEAADLARVLADAPDVLATMSLAGRTRVPAPQPLPLRLGGFGGVDGLRRWLRETATDCVIDATHPFAAQMAAHAAQACAAEGVRRAKLLRAPWVAQPGDRWTCVATLNDAVAALGPIPSRVFLPIGRGSLAPFVAAPDHHYLVRSIEPPGDLSYLPQVETIVARPPFTIESERALMVGARIDVVVAKNGGGTATVAKLAAARDLGLRIIMITQPKPPDGCLLQSVEAALAFVHTD